MTKLHYCNTTYTTDPPTDINPLILQLYQEGILLALCARSSMIKRIDNIKSSDISNLIITPMGWWQLVDPGFVLNYDVVVIIGRDRVDTKFQPLLEKVEFLLCK